ncbi:MAG: alpha/beta fold hydrolase [Pseudomonadota bacterium]
MLHTETYGEGGPKLLIAHGLFGSSRNWGSIAKLLGQTRRVTVPDMRNHGDSPWFDSHSYADMASDLAPLAGGDVIGHSMGGKAAMVLALTQPDRVKRLIVADMAPAAYTHTHAHFIEAMLALDLSNVRTRGHADRALAEAIPDRGVRVFLLQALDVKAQRWTLNLEVLLSEMDQIVGWPEIGGRYEGPTLFLSGGASDYVLPKHRDSIRTMFPAAKFAAIPGAGHWLHAEQPAEFIAAVDTFLTLAP